LDFLIFEGRIMPRDRGAINRCIGPDRDPESLSRDCRGRHPLFEVEVFGFLPDVSLAEDKLRNGAVHVTIVRPGMTRAVALTAPHWPPSR
jgi:hypothetical protein